jgi:hypothetical protein
MKATALLRQQHKEVASLFKEAERSTDDRARRRLVEEIAKNLEMHTAIEEEIFYPALQQAATQQKACEMMFEAFEEHHVVRLVLGELPHVDPGAENFKAKLIVLKELVEHHVEEEHEEMFPWAEKHLEKDELDALGMRLEQRAAEMLGEAPRARKRA